MGAIRVHEFISLDGIIDAPTWTMGYEFDPEMPLRLMCFGWFRTAWQLQWWMDHSD